MKRSIFLAMVLGFGLVSIAQGQESSPVEERARPGGRSAAAEPESPVMTRVHSQENQTAEPRLVKVGGVLIDSMGRPLSGDVQVTFTLYKHETDEEPLWTETQKLQSDKQGGYTALLGSTQTDGVPAELFRSDEARWLGVQVEGQPQQSRILFVSVPYALKAVEAQKLGGKSVSDFVLSASLGEQVRQVIQAQGQVAAQPTLTGTLQPGQTKANSTLSPQVTSAGPMFPPSTFSGTNGTQIVSVQQKGTGAGLVATTASGTGSSGVVGLATSTSTSSNQNGVYGQNAGAGAGVAGIATNSSAGVGVYGQSESFAGVFGRAASTTGFANGVYGDTAASSGFVNGVYGHTSSTGGNGVLGIADATAGYANGISGQTASQFGAGVFGNATNGQTTGVFGQTVQWVGVGGQASATSGGPAYGVWGDSSSTSGTGVAGYADATSGNTNGVYGLSVSPSGNGVTGVNNSSSGGNGVAGFATSTTGNTNGVYGQNSSPNGAGAAGVASATTGFNEGVYGATFSNEGAGVSGNAYSTSGNPVGVVGDSAGANGGIGAWGIFRAASGSGVGVRGDLESPTASGAAGQFLAFSPTSVAGQFANFSHQGLILQGLSGPFDATQKEVFTVDANGNLHISGNLTVEGTKSSTAKLQNGREVALYAVESPENWFEDFGSAELKSGVAWVPLDASFGEATNAAVTYHVFLTPNGDSNGLYVARKTATGFEVREQGGGGSNVAFDYRIVVRRRGYETIRLAEVHHDTKIQELSRQHFREFNSSEITKRAGTVRTAPVITAIRPMPPRPSVPELPRSIVPQQPRPR